MFLMDLIQTTVKLDYQTYIFLTNLKKKGETNDEFISNLVDECEKVIDKVEYRYGRHLRVYTLKLSPKTIEKLNNLKIKYKTTRSDVIRRLIYAKGSKLC